jgi:RNA polymerase primary sigma factor
MVVDYWEPGGLLVDQPFHASLRVGQAHGDSSADQAAEEFLRAAEPPAHSEWMPGTDRIRAEYSHGAQAAVRNFLAAISEALRAVLQEETPRGTEPPEQFRKLFPLPGIGTPEPREPFRLSNAHGKLEDHRWSFGGTFTRSSTADGEWTFRVALTLDQESGGAGELLGIAALQASGGTAANKNPDGSWDISVSSTAHAVDFFGKTESIELVPEGGLSQTRVRLDVRALLEGIE